MHAAVVTSFDSPPSYQSMAAPAPQGPHEILVDVLAAGLHPRVRSQANGSHYSSTADLPLVPGIDGVGRTTDGEIRYFVLPDTTMGSMAEQTVVDLRRSIVLPSGADPVHLAAVMNPAMSSWVALRRRVRFEPGQFVLVLGATGNAGRLAVEVARHLGAGRVVGAARRADLLASLHALGADETVQLDPDGGSTGSEASHRLGEVAGEADVVIDYLWGRPAADAMRGIVENRRDRGRALTWIQIGSVAGPDAPIPSAALRAANLQIVGSGQGSVSTGDILAELPELVAAISGDSFRVSPRAVPLEEVEGVWADRQEVDRVVFVP